jgi:hypothetical protein
MPKARIVFVCNPLRVGGSPTVFLELARAAVGAGFEAIVASWGGELAAQFAEAGAQVVRLPVRRGIAPGRSGSLVSMAKTAASTLGIARLVSLCTHRPTVLHASQPWPVAIAAAASRLSGRPLVWHAHGTTSVEMPPAWMSTVRAASAAWVGITPEVYQALCLLGPGPDVQVLEIPNPIRTPGALEAASRSGPPTPGQPVILGMVSTLTPNKREYVEACLMAASDLGRSGLMCEVRVVGDGPDADYLRRTAYAIVAASPGMTVRFLGSTLNPWPLLIDCHLVIGMGLVALEAAARGHNVVCAGNEGIGGRLSVGSYEGLHETNFTGRGRDPLHAHALAETLMATLMAGADSDLSSFVRSRHGPEARGRWISLWKSVL